MLLFPLEPWGFAGATALVGLGFGVDVEVGVAVGLDVGVGVDVRMGVLVTVGVLVAVGIAILAAAEAMESQPITNADKARKKITVMRPCLKGLSSPKLPK